MHKHCDAAKQQQRRDDMKRKQHPSPSPPPRPPPFHRSSPRKPFAELGHSQRHTPISRAKQLLNEMDVPLDALVPSAPSPASLLHLSTAERVRFRTVDGINLPSERPIINLKNELANTHGTATKSTKHNNITIAYISNPLLFINTVAAASSYISIGGDCGGGLTKLGISYTNVKGDEQFAALLVMDAADDWESLSMLCHIGVTQYEGKSEDIPTIWGVFQSLLFTHTIPPHNKKIFLNGDWKFINTVLGLKSPSSSFPCPICLVPHDDLLSPAPPRNLATHLSDDFSAAHVPFIAIPTSYIVPTPLHLFLGICNRIIRRTLAELSSEETVKEAMHEVKSIHSHSSGAAAGHELNGVELSKWIKEGLTLAFIDPTTPSPINQLDEWMKGLHKHLLHKREWSEEEKKNFNLSFSIFKWTGRTQQAHESYLKYICSLMQHSSSSSMAI